MGSCSDCLRYRNGYCGLLKVLPTDGCFRFVSRKSPPPEPVQDAIANTRNRQELAQVVMRDVSY